MERTLTVGILMFTGIEPLDFIGPLEVFSVASRVAERDGDTPFAPFKTLLVGRTDEPVRARYGLVVTPGTSIASCPALDILIVPGGIVTEPLSQSDVIDWVRKRHEQASLSASVCTGAFILGKAGLLDGLSATTHWEDLEELRRAHPHVNVLENVAFVDEGRIITSAGVSTGIEMSLNIVADLLGEDAAYRTARQMVYSFEPTPRSARPGSMHHAAQAGDWRASVRGAAVAL